MPVTNMVGENATVLRRSTIVRRRAAFEIDLAGGHEVEAVSGRHRPPDHPDVFAEFRRDLLDHDFAEVERVPHGLAPRVEEREGRRILAIADADFAAVVDLLERSRVRNREGDASGCCALAGWHQHNASAAAIVGRDDSRKHRVTELQLRWRTRAATDADAAQPCVLIMDSSPFRRDRYDTVHCGAVSPL